MRPSLLGRLSIVLVGLILSACRSAPTPLAPTSPQPTGTLPPTLTAPPALTATSTPLPPDLPVFPVPDLATIDFQDAQRGWGIAVNETGRLVRTVDGGRTWLDATPSEAGPLGLSSRLFALDSERVWLSLPNADYYSGTLFHTSDGGVTWTSNQVPFGGVYIQFVDNFVGFALADLGASAGAQAVALYHTADAGVTWERVFHNDPTQSGAADSLPRQGIKNGMVFLDASNGWVSGSQPTAGSIYLYKTSNGGSSWEQVPFSSLSGYANTRFMAHPPLFFGREGILPVTVYREASSVLTFFHTTDGGSNWTGGLVPVDPGLPDGLYSFATSLDAWCWDGSGAVFGSRDGGQSWSITSSNLDLTGRLNQLVFVPAGDGSFVGFALTSLDENDHSQLYITTDEGVTWTPLLP
jgi:photosystem II stability/assembly factor-like uncharacterized protein